jgi:hypothetical protein
MMRVKRAMRIVEIELDTVPLVSEEVVTVVIPESEKAPEA